MFETSLIELSRSALRNNIRFLKKQIPRTAAFSSVIKGNAYGHGISVFVPMAESSGVRHFSVFNAHEALQAFRSRTADSEIMIMGSIDNAQIPWAVENGISFYVFELDRLRRALAVARKMGVRAKIHLELETGLNRTGFRGAGVRKAIALVVANPDLVQLEGVCTHFAGAESSSNFFRIQKQIGLYRELCAGIAQAGLELGGGGARQHTACSAAALVFPETAMGMVRFGIAQYGFWPSKETEINFFAQHLGQLRSSRWRDPLTRIIKWKSRVMSSTRVKRGDYVGYGSSSLITRDARVASVPVGYFNGFSRDMSNRGHVLIRGRRAPVTGMVNMNMMMVDVTDIPGVRKGDEVVLIGKQGENTISVGSFGELTRTINYELLVSLPAEIPRVVVD